jgi:hypothetical protein
MRLLLAFSLLEVVANIYGIYGAKNLGNRDLLMEWLNKYCFVPGNAMYDQHVDIKKIDAEFIYKFRNAIIHFFALPDELNGVHVVVPNGSDTHASLQGHRNGFASLGHNVVFISADTLTGLILAGTQRFFLDIPTPDGNPTLSDLEGLKGVLAEMERRGGKKVSL